MRASRALAVAAIGGVLRLHGADKPSDRSGGQDLERIGQSRAAIFCAKSGGLPVALVRLEAGDLRPVRVLKLIEEKGFCDVV